MIIYLISIFCFPVFLGMFAVAEEIFVVILTSKWLPGLFAFKCFCLLGLLLSYKGILLVMLKSRGKTRPVFLFSVYSVILLPLSFIIMARYGLNGMALSWIIIYPILFTYLLYNVIIDIDASLIRTLKKIFHAFMGSILILFIVFLLKVTIFKNAMTAWSLIAYIIVGIITYSGYFMAFSRESFTDVRRILRNLKA